MAKNNLNNQYEYSLRFNGSMLGYDDPLDIPFTQSNRRVDIIKSQNIVSLKKYANKGFLQIQNLVDNLILKQEISNPAAEIRHEVSSVSLPEFQIDNLAGVLGGNSQLIICVPLFLPYLRMVSYIMHEKETRIKEGMKIMGLTGNIFYLSWLITYSIIYTIISIFVSLIMKVSVLTYSSYGLIFLWHWLFCLSILAIGLLCTVFFNNAKVGNIISFVVIFVMAWPSNFANSDQTTRTAKFWATAAPMSSIQLSSIQIFELEVTKIGVTTDTLDLMYNEYKLSWHYIWAAIITSVALILTFYFDQVIPGQFGVSKHPLFCLMKKKKRDVLPHENQTNDSITKTHVDNPENFEAVDPTLKTQDDRSESIQVKHLRKVYSNSKVAVQGVTYNMYKGQIFALLGHNGAGKTSTINMITGLYPSTSGTVNVFGFDIHEDLDTIRKSLGVCPQHDVLFDDLTIQEHLELFAAFKGVSKNQIQGEIQQILKDLELDTKKDYLAKFLSGGEKRRLSVGIAFIGGSKFILLDEPTSGMDTAARRKLWDMLKNSKSGKVILLTTHYMDEADFLGDRIAIMGEGKIQCLGSSLFLKHKFGVGYNLTIGKAGVGVSTDSIVKEITKFVPEAKITSDVSSELIIQLPVERVGKFAEMFKSMESKQKELGILTYGVSVTTLEEVFLNVAKHVNSITKPAVLPGDEELSKFDLIKERETNSLKNFWVQFLALLWKRFITIKRDKRGLLLELAVPIFMVVIGIAVSKNTQQFEIIPLDITSNTYGEPTNVIANQIDISKLTTINPTFWNYFNTGDFKFDPTNINSLQAFDGYVYSKRSSSPSPKFAVFPLSFDTSTNKYAFHVEIDSRTQDASTFALNQINQAVLR